MTSVVTSKKRIAILATTILLLCLCACAGTETPAVAPTLTASSLPTIVPPSPPTPAPTPTPDPVLTKPLIQAKFSIMDKNWLPGKNDKVSPLRVGWYEYFAWKTEGWIVSARMEVINPGIIDIQTAILPDEGGEEEIDKNSYLPDKGEFVGRFINLVIKVNGQVKKDLYYLVLAPAPAPAPGSPA